jgi:aminocarboxymuconate-semialdehyde decarboxylase
MKIDIHAHIVDRAYLQALESQCGLAADRTTPGRVFLRKGTHTFAWSREDMFDIDQRLRDMDRKAIDMRVLSLSTPNVYVWPAGEQPAMARLMNDAVARLCRAHPDRFAGLASLPLGDIETSLVEIDRALDELGMVGVTIGSNVGGVPLNDARFEPIWAHLDARRVPVFEHPMFPAHTADMEEFELPLRLGFVFDTTLAAARMIYSGIFARYPNFPYILAHTGGTLLMVIERLDNGYRLFPDCRKHISELPSVFARRLYYDTTSFFPPALRMALDFAGPERLLWGTDDPYIGSDAAHVQALGLAPGDSERVLGGNAAALLGLTRAPAQAKVA